MDVLSFFYLVSNSDDVGASFGPVVYRMRGMWSGCTFNGWGWGGAMDYMQVSRKQIYICMNLYNNKNYFWLTRCVRVTKTWVWDTHIYVSQQSAMENPFTSRRHGTGLGWLKPAAAWTGLAPDYTLLGPASLHCNSTTFKFPLLDTRNLFHNKHLQIYELGSPLILITIASWPHLYCCPLHFSLKVKPHLEWWKR